MNEIEKKLYKRIKFILSGTILLFFIALFTIVCLPLWNSISESIQKYYPNNLAEELVVIPDYNEVDYGYDDLANDPNKDLVGRTCTACHSSKLITQNRASREGWEEMIRWMQETQGLGPLGEFEDPILDYLAKYYAPKETGRRLPLQIGESEWYVLEPN